MFIEYLREIWRGLQYDYAQMTPEGRFVLLALTVGVLFIALKNDREDSK